MAVCPRAKLTVCCLHCVLHDMPRHSISGDLDAGNGGHDVGEDWCVGDGGKDLTHSMSFSLSLGFTDRCA